MKQNKTIIRLLVICNLFMSCGTDNSIEICYIDAGMELNTAINPKSFLRNFKGVKAEKIRISASDFNSIYSGEKSTNIPKKWQPEVRFCIKKRHTKYFLNSFYDAFTEKYDSVVVPHETINLLRKVSGYYNRIEIEDLQDMLDIKDFGIPDNYIYTPPKFREVGFKKVILLKMH